MIYRSPNSIGSLFFNCPIRRTVTVKTRNIYKKQHGARGYIAPPKMKVPPDEKTCGHADIKLNIMQVREDKSVLLFPILYFLRKKLGSYGV